MESETTGKPIPEPARGGAAEPAGEAVPTVLVVDDDPDVLRIVQFYLKKHKYGIHTATSGEEALEILGAHPEVELVLSDVMMPGMSGLDLLQAVRADPALADRSVVLISAEGQTAKKVAGLDLGADDYITKPFNFDELMARVRSHIRLRRLQREVVQKNELLRRQNDQFLTDLEAAHNVQMALMPQRFPELPGVRFGSRYVPLDRLGGDFFDVVDLDGGRKLGLFIADVCGHGITAAFVTAMTKISFRNACFTSDDPGRVLSQMNRELFAHLHTGYVTVFYAVLDLERLTLTFSSGGHPPVLVHRPATGELFHLEPQATFLGFFEPVRFPTDQFRFAEGDRLLFYTDGLYEGHNGHGEQYGMERVIAGITGHPGLAAQPLLDRLLADLFDFIGEATLDDDITLLGVDIRPKDPAAAA